MTSNCRRDNLRSLGRGLTPGRPRAGSCRRGWHGHVLALFTTITVLIPCAASAQQPTFEAVVGNLRHPDPSERIKAIRQLSEAGHPEAIAPLAAVLTDPDDRVQFEAIDAERSLFTAEPVARKRRVGYVVEVRAPSVGERALAGGPLAVVPRAVPPEVLAGLAAAMRDENPRVRLEALYAFGIIAPLAGRAWQLPGLRDGVAWTIESLRRGQLPLQVAAAQVSARVLKDCGVTPIPASEGGNPSPCAAMGDALIEGMNSREAPVRLASMRALGQLRYPSAVQALTDQFAYYRHGEAAEAALEGLAGIAHASSMPLFGELLGRGEPAIRLLAIEGIGRSGDRSQLAGMERIAGSDKSETVRLGAAYASQKLGSPSRPDQLIAALGNPVLRGLAQMYLIDVSTAASSALVESLRDPNPVMRAMVADILGFSSDDDVVPALEAARKDADAGASRAAERALARIRLAATLPKP
jgi:HEAT repeat protein